MEQQQQQPRPPQASRAKTPASSKAMWITKLLLRIFSACSCIVTIGITASISTQTPGSSSSYYYYYSFFTAAPVIVLVPECAVALIWDIAEGICILVRGGRRGIHPGAIVAIDLLLWLGFIVGTIWFGLFNFVSYTYDSYYYDLDDAPYLETLGIVVLAFSGLLVLVHFTLFVFGCVETSRRNRSSPMIIYSGAPPMQPFMYGQQPLVLPAGQAPPPGWVPYAYGPPQGDAAQDHYPQGQYPYAQDPGQKMPSHLQTPSPVHTNSQPGDQRSSYQPSNGPHQDFRSS